MYCLPWKFVDVSSVTNQIKNRNNNYTSTKAGKLSQSMMYAINYHLLADNEFNFTHQKEKNKQISFGE